MLENSIIKLFIIDKFTLRGNMIEIVYFFADMHSQCFTLMTKIFGLEKKVEHSKNISMLL